MDSGKPQSLYSGRAHSVPQGAMPVMRPVARILLAAFHAACFSVVPTLPAAAAELMSAAHASIRAAEAGQHVTTLADDAFEGVIGEGCDMLPGLRGANARMGGRHQFGRRGGQRRHNAETGGMEGREQDSCHWSHHGHGSLRDGVGASRIERLRFPGVHVDSWENEERWQSGRMRVFAKDVSGQKLDRGFESRPLRVVLMPGRSEAVGV